MTIEQRKVDHIKLAQDTKHQMNLDDPWAKISLPYLALPEINLKEVSTATKILGKKVSQPLIMASMTGGSNHSLTINTHLAIAANECNLAMGVGSMRVALDVAGAKDSFTTVRKHAPKSVIFANMGAIQ